MKIDKRDLILQSIIRAYLEQNEPVGSSQLCEKIENIFSQSIPASTIRVYFKHLSDEGAITQLHISGGRIPTASAMKFYWQNRLNLDEDISIYDDEVLSFLVYNFGIYCMVFGSNNPKFTKLHKIDEKFLLLELENESFSINYSLKIEKFLKNLLGLSLDELELVSIQVGLSQLRAKIKEFKRSLIYFQENEKIAFEMFSDERIKTALDPVFAHSFKSKVAFGPLFDEGFMGFIKDVNFMGKNATMICAGSVYNDYEKFLNTIKEAS